MLCLVNLIESEILTCLRFDYLTGSVGFGEISYKPTCVPTTEKPLLFYATGLDLICSILRNIVAHQSSTMATHTDRMRQIV